MWRTARESVCLLCRSAAAASRRTARLDPGAQWTPRRAFATRRERPSRMVLSDRVSSGGPRASDRPSSHRSPEGPFGGMNRTVANVDPPPPPPPPARGRDARDKESGGGGGGGGGGREEGDFKALKMHRSLATISYRERSLIKARIADIESFDQFNLLPPVRDAVDEALKGLSDIRPTPVQRLAIPALLGRPLVRHRSSDPRRRKSDPDREEFLLAAETGSGKTLAYLIPTFNALKEAEAGDEAVRAYNERLEEEKKRRGDAPVSEWIDEFEPHPNTARPRAIVLVPTAELVDQVLATGKAMSHVAKLKVRALSASYKPEKIHRNIYSPGGVDVIISTPYLLGSIAEKDPNILARVRHLVVDEADSLFDRSFAPRTTSIIDRALPSLRQLILCSATITRSLDNFLAANFPHMQRITTPNLHAIPRRVQLGVIDVSKDPYRNDKLLACADAIWSIGKDAARHELPDGDVVDVKRILVFVNERDTTREVADYLVSKGIDAVALHRDTPELRQGEMLDLFRSAEPMRISRDEAERRKQEALARSGGRRWLPNVKVLVATDLASRGVDTLAVRHVVLYDVPHNSIDFIHRLGRAGRMGRRGRGIVLVGKGDRRDVVADVKESMFMGQALI